jgi:ribosomal-protein-alanine N-acetyltransferase
MLEAEKRRPPQIEFRTVTERDILDVMDINRICLPENYTYGFFEELAKNYPKAFWVAVHNGRVVGYVMCRVERVFSKFDFLKVRRAGHIVSVAVLPQYRRMGLAEELMRRSLKALRFEYGCDEAYLEVRISNTPAIELYHKLGFKERDVLRRYYADGEDALLMAIRLQDSG